MDWQDQLHEIVERTRRTPTFAEWLQTTGYAEMPKNIANLVQMRSVMRTMYLRYLSEYGNAA